MQRNHAEDLPSTQRPVPLVSRVDLIAKPVVYQGIGYWVIKDPVSLDYYRLKQEQYEVCRLLDGQRSLEQLRDQLQRKYPALRPSLSDVQRLAVDLHAKGLVVSQRPRQGVALLERNSERQRKRAWAAVKNVLYIRLPGFDPEFMLQRLYPLVAWLFHPVAISASVMLIVSSWTLLLIQFASFQTSLPQFQQFFGWPNLLFLWLTMGVVKIIHEFAHGLACKHHGGECHEIGVAFLVLSPCFYCDVSDSWVLSSKWRRISIAAAGVFTELTISAIAIFLWWFTQPGMLHHLCLNVFFVTTVTTVIFNLNPLLRFDGYYILADLLEIPNLRAKADKSLFQSVARICFGIEFPSDPFVPQRGRIWFVLYSFAAAIYRWFLVFAIMFMLYELLKPYGLQNLGLGLGVFSAITILTNLVMKIARLILAPRRKRMRYVRIGVSGLLLAGCVLAVCMIPLPLYVDSSFVVEPAGVQHVYTSTAGHLAAIYVQPGQRVKKGDILIQLSNFSRADRCHQLQIELQVQQLEVEIQQTLQDAAQEELASAKLRGIEKQLAEAVQQLEALSVVAQIDGYVVAAPLLPKPSQGNSDSELEHWSGSPLDARNLGCIIQPRTHIVSIAPTDKYEVVLVVDQLDRNDVQVGLKVKIKLDSRPNQTFSGVVQKVAQRHLELVPKPLSNKFGGKLPTTTDSEGRERLVNPAYQAIASIDAEFLVLKPGARGQARFVVDSRTSGEWLWRYLRRTLHFRI